MAEMASLIDHFPYVGIFLLLAIGDLGLPFPEDITLILSGVLISQKVIKPLPTFLVIYPTLLLTDFFLYSVGKKYGRKVIENKRLRRLISPQGLSKFEERFRKWGIFVVFVGRHFLGIRAQVFLAAGVVRMSAIKFLIADGASAILTVTLMIEIGYLGGNSIQVLKQDVTRTEHIVIVSVMILVTLGIIFMYFKNRTKKT
jgi:membrane protein DedA with SNARE-associated domain